MPKVGYKQSKELIQKRVAAFPRKYSDEHWNWKGNAVSYSGNHKWITRHKGKASRCEFQDESCSTKFEWSNKSKTYQRSFDDWQQLCASHHRRYDGHSTKAALAARWAK